MTSTTSSRKRVREVSWEDVMQSAHLHGIPNKEECIQELQLCVDNASKFLEFSQHTQRDLCESFGITGWEDQLISAINDTVKIG